MSYQVRSEEVLEALVGCEHPRAKLWQALFESVVNAMATDLADHLGVECGVGDFQGVAFAGMCVPFSPKEPGQPLPQVFVDNEFDNIEQWEVNDDDE